MTYNAGHNREPANLRGPNFQDDMIDIQAGMAPGFLVDSPPVRKRSVSNSDQN